MDISPLEMAIFNIGKFEMVSFPIIFRKCPWGYSTNMTPKWPFCKYGFTLGETGEIFGLAKTIFVMCWNCSA